MRTQSLSPTPGFVQVSRALCSIPCVLLLQSRKHDHGGAEVAQQGDFGGLEGVPGLLQHQLGGPVLPPWRGSPLARGVLCCDTFVWTGLGWAPASMCEYRARLLARPECATLVDA